MFFENRGGRTGKDKCVGSGLMVKVAGAGVEAVKADQGQWTKTVVYYISLFGTRKKGR